MNQTRNDMRADEINRVNNIVIKIETGGSNLYFML